MAQSFLHNIRYAHSSTCVWKNTPCNESFEHLPNDTNILKQQLIENLKTWTQTDNHSFYVIPKIDSTAKRIMLQSLNGAQCDWTNSEYSVCCDVLLFAGSGWCLTQSFDQNHYVQCKYCNKCISVQSYEYKKVLSLLPEDYGNEHANNSFLERINEEKEEEDSNANADMSDIDAESIIFKLSKLGLRIEPNIRRTHGFQIYETVSLQKPAHFNTNARSRSRSPSQSFLSVSSSGFRPFGSNIACNNDNVQSMRWPKLSIFSRKESVPNTKALCHSQTKRRKKRSHRQMTKDASEQVLDVNGPRKKMKTVNEKRKLRRSRKRKHMDSDFDEADDSEQPNVSITKRRRLASISSTSSLCPSPNPNKKKRKSRKRKFGEVFLKNDEDETDEDDDVKSDERLFGGGRPSKRIRVDTPIVRRKKHFDPINLHNDFCPFKNQHKYEQQCVFGWMYCLRLLPNDVMYIKQLAEESKAKSNSCNQAKSRF